MQKESGRLNLIPRSLLYRRLKDRLATPILLMFSLSILSIGLLIACGLYIHSKPILAQQSTASLLFSFSWHPGRSQFGLAPFIIGTCWVTIIAATLAVPISLLAALYLTEYCKPRIRSWFKPVIDILGGISPVIYGIWGLITVVPFVREKVIPFCSKHIQFFPFVSDNDTGYSVLAGGIVLAVMILPIIIAVLSEALSSLPSGIRAASLALGASGWQTIHRVVLKKAKTAIIASVILGISRALGETIAVLMVAGCNLHQIPASIFDPGYPLSALIANTYGEMMSIPLYDSAIMLAALALMAVSFLFNSIAQLCLIHYRQQE